MLLVDKLVLLAARYYWFEKRSQRGIVVDPPAGLECVCAQALSGHTPEHDNKIQTALL
jgi:hypothetical protein